MVYSYILIRSSPSRGISACEERPIRESIRKQQNKSNEYNISRYGTTEDIQHQTEPVREWNKTDRELYRSREILVSSVLRSEPELTREPETRKRSQTAAEG